MNYQKVIESIEKDLKECLGDKKAIVGISGGIDSAVVATLCARAVGKENVLGILMPFANQSTTDGESLVQFLGIKNKKINIGEIVGKFDYLNFKDLCLGNIKARVRMIVLYSFANEMNGMVIGTSNKTEMEIGYFTKYGDGGCDVEPIADIYKTEIFELAKVLGIPKNIIEKKPSAELYAGQTDEGEIGASYNEIDAILKKELTEGKIYDLINERIKRSEHKRKMPITFQLGGAK